MRKMFGFLKRRKKMDDIIKGMIDTNSGNIHMIVAIEHLVRGQLEVRNRKEILRTLDRGKQYFHQSSDRLRKHVPKGSIYHPNTKIEDILKAKGLEGLVD